MSSIVFFAFLVADIRAFTIPGTPIEIPNVDFISKSIAKGIEDASQSIREAGLDPMYINETHVAMALPVPVLFNCNFLAQNISSMGMSNIVTHQVSYSLINSSFSFDIEFPFIDFSVGAASVEVMLFSKSFNVKASGKLGIQRVRIAGEVFIKIGTFSGISIDRININFALGKIISDIKLIVQGKDQSAKINNFFRITVPTTIKAHQTQINELLETILKDVINESLP